MLYFRTIECLLKVMNKQNQIKTNWLCSKLFDLCASSEWNRKRKYGECNEKTPSNWTITVWSRSFKSLRKHPLLSIVSDFYIPPANMLNARAMCIVQSVRFCSSRRKLDRIPPHAHIQLHADTGTFLALKCEAFERGISIFCHPQSISSKAHNSGTVIWSPVFGYHFIWLIEWK